MNEETVTFEFPRELVEKADVVKARDYWDAAAKDPHRTPVDRLRSVLSTQILEWQEAQPLKVTPETPNGTEVEIVEEPQLVPVFLVGPDPLEPDGYAVVVTGEGKLFAHKWEELRPVELAVKEDNSE